MLYLQCPLTTGSTVIVTKSTMLDSLGNNVRFSTEAKEKNGKVCYLTCVVQRVHHHSSTDFLVVSSAAHCTLAILESAVLAIRRTAKALRGGLETSYGEARFTTL